MDFGRLTDKIRHIKSTLLTRIHIDDVSDIEQELAELTHNAHTDLDRLERLDEAVYRLKPKLEALAEAQDPALRAQLQAEIQSFDSTYRSVSTSYRNSLGHIDDLIARIQSLMPKL